MYNQLEVDEQKHDFSKTFAFLVMRWFCLLIKSKHVFSEVDQ